MHTTFSRELRCYYNWFSQSGLPTPNNGWLAAIQEAGYHGVQFAEPLDIEALASCRALGLCACGSGRVNHAEDAFRLAAEARTHGLEALTLHVGWGYEDDWDAFTLIESVLAASEQFSIPLYVETHRATIFQDQWRTVQFVRRFPALRFNGDFSHWYTGLEMVYGDFDKKLDFIQPVIDRVCFIHGRIGNPGSIQVNIGTLDAALRLPYVQHFCCIWKRVFRSYLEREHAVPFFCFTVELLAADIYYAREFEGREESNRWQQSLVLCEIANRCFSDSR
jgi:hypothetical protein